jgi:alpha-D-xyloside xylohydrolase
MIKQLHDEHAHLMVVSWAKFDVTDKGVSIPNLKELEAVNGVYEPAIPYVYPPGRGKWYDPFNDKARQIYWNQLNKRLFSVGVDAWWLDASEAELSGNWGEYRNFKTAKGSGAVVYNAYPLEHTRTLYEGQRAATNRKRVFLLTRSAYAGQQRNGAVNWSGDIQGKWEVFQSQIPAGLNFVASGIPYWNTDICGFFGNHPGDPKFTELCTRWFQYGSFTPMFRVHGTDEPKEVWRFDPETQATLTNFIRLRYHLLPYIYSTS